MRAQTQSVGQAQPQPAASAPLQAGPTAVPASTDPEVANARAFGRLERESLEEAMSALGLRLEPQPAGKIVGVIHVVNGEVFSRRDWLFQLFNFFHRTTRPGILQRELLIHPGALYDEALVEESVRNLQSPAALDLADGTIFYQPELSSVVAVVPVVSDRPDTVDLLAVTRDVWSLRFNTDFEFQQNTLSNLTTSLSENNLLGWRKYLALGFELDQGRAGVGPSYFDPNILGTRLTLLAQATAWYARDTRDYEGNFERFSLRYPLYALASRWGGGVDVNHQDEVIRSFRGNSLRTEDLPSTPEVEQLPFIYRRKIEIVDANVVRSFGLSVIQRLTLGHRFDSRSSEVLPDFPTDPANPDLAREFLNEVAPLSERRSEPYLRYEMFTARYVVLRNLNTFDLRENRRLGPHVVLEAAAGLPALGADFEAFPVSGTVGWAFGPRGGYAGLQVAAGARLRPGNSVIDQSFGASLILASPILGRLLRVVVEGEAGAVRADTHRSRFYLGGSTGLRGYVIGDFAGTDQVLGHVEIRTMPLELFSQRIGGLLFYDVGHAAESFSAIVPHHDFGIGLRWLIPQLNSSVVRFDWAVATQGTSLTRAGLPGRITAGFMQIF